MTSAALSGIVWSQSGDAVAGARVTASRPRTALDARLALLAGTPPAVLASTVTDEHGVFTIEQKIDGVVVVAVEHDGFAPERRLTTGDDAMVSFELARAPRRAGRVTANGKSVAGARVIALADEQTPRWTTVTGDDGTFAMPEPSGWASAVVIVHPDQAPLHIEPRAPRTSLDATLSGGARVAGKVVDKGGRPVASARVIAGDWTTAMTSEDGQFVIGPLPSDVKRIAAFADTSWGDAPLDAQGTTITLGELPSIGGTVRDANKRPLPFAAVAAHGSRHGSPVPRFAVADERGRFRIEHCLEPAYTVNAYAVGDLAFEGVTIAAGRTADLTARATRFLTGIVVDEQKRPIAGARVQYSADQYPLLYGHAGEDFAGASARTGRDGRFRLPSGDEMPAYAARVSLRLRAFARGYAMGLSKEIDFKSGVTITLSSGIALHGSVVDAEGKAVAGAGIVAVQDPFGAMPLPLESALVAGTIRPFVESDADGKFTLHLNPAPHDFGVWKASVGSARAGGVDVAAGSPPLRVVLERGVAIRGRVVAPGGKPVSGGRILATGGEMAFGATRVADDGTFVVEELRPGTYELQYEDDEGRSAVASAKAPSDDAIVRLQATGAIVGRVVDAETNTVLRSFTVNTAPGFQMKAFEDVETFALDVPPGDVTITIEADGYSSATQQVTVTADETSEVTIAVTRGRTARGRVLDESGAPVAEAMVNAVNADDITTTAEDGTWTLTLPKAPVTIGVRANGYREKSVEVAGEGDVQLDIVLARGRTARGRVVSHEGTPVAGAQVAAVGEDMQRASTDENGAFVIEGLGNGRYAFRAERDELASDPLENVDPAAGEIVLRMKPSAGAGVVRGRVKGFAESGWMFGFVRAAGQHAIIGRDGRYRFEKLPAGEVELHATASGMNDEMSSSRPVTVTVVANGTVEADLELRTDTVVRGTVTENGTPAAQRTVQFSAGDGQWRAKTNANGEYSIAGLEPGLTYDVWVTSSQRMFQTRYAVTSSATFDIRIVWARIEGRVLDATGTPIAGAGVQVESEETKSDSSGTFIVTLPQAEGDYAVTVEKEGFATATRRATADGAPLVITLMRTDGLRVRLVDARDGRTLAGYAIAVDDEGNLLARAQEQQPDGTLRLPVTAGAYRIAVSATGYASQLARSTVPRKDELRVALTAGGTLIVNTDRQSTDLIKLVMPGGEEYVQCQCNGIAEIRLTGTKTVVEHVAPGTYTMQVLDERGLVKASHPVAIAEGQTTVMTIHVPE